MVPVDYLHEVISRDSAQSSPNNDPIIFGKTKQVLNQAAMLASDQKLLETSRLYIKQVTLAQEAERLRIARELHDGTVQSLITVLYESERFLKRNGNCNTVSGAFITELTEHIRSIICDLRYLSSSLRPSVLEHLGLIPSLEFLIKQMETDYGIKSSLLVNGRSRRFLPEVEASIFRVVQEALQNVVRHAEATAVEVSLDYNGRMAKFIIKDNGKGIKEIPLSKEQLIGQRKLGLAGMIERVELIGGEVRLYTSPGRGTMIYVLVPMSGNITD